MNAAEAAYVELLEKKNSGLEEKITLLEEQLEWFQRQIFGQRSERHVKDLDSRQLYIKGLDGVVKL